MSKCHDCPLYASHSPIKRMRCCGETSAEAAERLGLGQADGSGILCREDLIAAKAKLDRSAPENLELIKPPIGKTVRFMQDGREIRGVVCAPDDPGRTGTFQSAKYGPIPVKLDRRNRKARRADEAKARGR